MPERKRKLFSNLKLTTLVLFAFTFLAVPSCEIGLGAQIDTERPHMEITYPPKGAIIMDSFILAGTVSDDMGVSYMNVTLTHKTLKTQFSYSSQNGEVIVEQPAKSWPDGTTWFAKIGKKEEGKTLYNGWDLPDGEYFVDVEVSDGIGSVYDRRSITIDNTPPVFIVENENPEGHINDRYYLFGQKINLSGKAKDESDLSKVFFNVYDTNKAQILSSKLDYEMTYDGVLLASYSETQPTDPQKRILADNFNTIYGITYGPRSLKEIKERYMTVRISDNARLYIEPVYKNLSEEETATLGKGDGNLSTEIFLDPQGKTTLSLEGITIDEICDYKTHLTEDKTFESKLKAMESTSVASVTADDFSKVMKIQINPDIFPKWFISNYGKNEGADYKDAFLGSPLTLQFEKGNNDESFRPSNIRIVLARLDETKDPIDGTKTFKVAASAEKLETVTTSDADVIVLRNYGDMSQDLTKSLAEQIEVTKSDAAGDELLKIASNYEVIVYGHDGSGQSGYKFHPKEDAGYGFRVVKNQQPPRIFFLCNDDDYKSNNLPKEDSWIGPETQKIPFWFKVKTEESEILSSPTLVVTLEKGTNITYVIRDGYYELEKEEETGSGKERTFKWNLKRLAKALPTTPAATWDNEFTLRIAITAEDDAGTKITQPFTLQFDNKKPELTVGTPSVVVPTNSLNGTVTIPVSFSDNHKLNDAGTATYTITGKDSANAAKEVSGEVGNKGTITLNTTQFKNKENITIKVAIEDDLKNKTEKSAAYYVDQDTDIPQFSLTGLNADASAWNNFGIKINNMISGSIYDDDGIGKLEVQAKPATGSWGDAWKEISVANLKESDDWKWKSSIAYNFVNGGLITTDGKYQVRFRVTDTVGLDASTTLDTSTNTSSVYNLLVDGTEPAFGAETVKQGTTADASAENAIKSGSTYYAKKGQSLTISVPLTEANLKDVTVNVDGTAIATTGTAPSYTVTYTWTPSGTEKSGEKPIKFLATDLAGNTKEKEISIFYDADIPTMEEFTVTPVLKSTTVNGIISIKGRASDNDKIKEITVVATDSATPAIEKTWGPFTTASFDVENINTNEFTDGDLTFTISMTDRSGNTNSKDYTYTIDQSADLPTITFDANQIDENLTTHALIEAATAGKNMFGLDTDNVISGTVADDDAVDTVTIIAYKEKGTERVDSTKTYTTTKGSTLFSCNIKSDLGIESPGNYVIKASVTDDKDVTKLAAANKTEKTVYIVVDGVAPIIDNIKIDGEVYDKQAYINSSRTITFDVTEMHLKTVSWAVGTGTATIITKPEPKTIGGSKVYPYSFTYTPTANAMVKITAKDSAGLETTKELNITYDATKPVINDPTVEPLCTFDGKTNVVNGKIDISGIITDNDKVLDDKITVKLQRNDSDTWSDIDITSILAIENQRYKIEQFDTRTLKDKTDNEKNFTGEIRIVVNATDRSGNSAVEKISTYYVDQDSDIPVITFTSVNADATNAKDNLFGMGAWTIIGSVKDDDGLKNKDGTKVLKLYATETGGTAVEAAQTGNFTIDNSGGFKYIVPAKDNSSIKGDQEVTFKVVDLNGETDGRKKEVKIKYAVDREKPQFVSQTLNDVAYVENMFVRGAVSIKFTVSDDNAVSKLEYKNGTNYVGITKSGANEYTHSISGEADGTKTKTYRLTDKYGRDNEIELKYEIDTSNPGVDITKFKVDGNSVGSDGTIKDNGNDKWFNSAALAVSAVADAVKDKNLSTTVSYTLGSETGTFQMPLNATKNASTSFSHTRSFNEGKSTLTYTFKDAAGNSAGTAITVKVDTTAPTVSGLSLSGLTDGLTKENAITVNFTASDANGSLETSGLAKAELAKTSKFDDLYGEAITLSGASATKTPSIDISGLSDGRHEVWIRVTDVAGNVSTAELVGTFTIDRTNPTVTINSNLINDADVATTGTQVNKTITITGTASDTNASETVPVLNIYKAGTSNAITTSGLITQNPSTFGSWSYTVDTTKLTDKESYVFEVVATDKAGNTGSESITLYVDQDTDRPIVTLYNIEIDGKTTLSNGNIEWAVSDDDGVSTVEVQLTDSDATSAGGTWTAVTVSSGKYSYTVPDVEGTNKLDGSYKLWFKITDAESGTFISSTSTATNADLSKPKVKKEVTDTPTGKPIEFAVDTEPPVIDEIKISFKSSATGASYGASQLLTNGIYVGGTLKRYGKVEITAHDAVITDPDNLKYMLNGEEISKTQVIDFGDSTLENGLYTMVFEVYDNAGMPATKPYLIYIDNLKPDNEGKAVTNVIPSSSTEVTGTVTVTASISDDSVVGCGIDTNTVAYYIPKKYGTVNETTPSAIADDKWTYAKDDESFNISEVLMSFDITGLSTTDAKIVSDYSGHPETSRGSEVYNIPIWIKLSDKVGNTSYVTNNTIKYNPDAARPRVAVTYPTHTILSTDTGNTYNKDYVVLGGNIRIAGSAQDNVGVKEVYVQYDINGDGKYDKTDYDWFVGQAGYELVKPIPTRTNETLVAGTSSDCWGIKAKGTSSWNTTFDATSLSGLELNNTNKTKTLNVRVCAVDTDYDENVAPQHVSAWSEEIHISVDNNMPSYGKFYVVQYSDGNYTTEIGRTDYIEDMFISTKPNGNEKYWRLEGYVGDNGGISEVQISGTQNGDLTTTGWFTEFTEDEEKALNLKGYNIHIPIPSSVTEFKLNIESSDNSDPALTNPSSYSIKIDNEAPKFIDGADENTLVLFQGDYATKSKIETTTKLQNNNGGTTIASKANDEASGFAKAVFYAKRTGSANRVYNIMEKHGNDRTANRTDLVASETPDEVYINDDGLPVLKKTVTRSSEYTIGVTGIGSNKNIRAGGAVLIGGFYRTIASVAANEVTLTEGVDVKYTDAYFVYGMVVNNSGESERNGTIKGDDGDGMVESITKSGSDYVWDARFDSTHIPDGPIEFHVVVFDNAENMRHSSISARISNNSPRLARVTLGTDLNGDGVIKAEDDECKTYNYSSKYEDDSTYTTDKLAYEMTAAQRNDFTQVWDLDSATVRQGNGGDNWKIKNKLRVAPEFVGGTAPFYYVFSKAEGIGEGKRLTKETRKTAENLSSAEGNSGDKGTFDLGEHVELSNTTIGAAGEDQTNTYQFTFWDSTEESVVGSETDWTVLNVELYQDIVDAIRPKPIIHPFFWKAKGSVAAGEAPNNSIQWDDKGVALGHIELEGDWEKASGYKPTDTSGVYDLDPKVSGKIVLRGTAFDETRLTEVKVTASDNSLLGADGITSTYTPSSKSWSTETADGVTLTVSDCYLSQKGHLVEWTLEVDTQNLTDKVGTDIKFTVQAKDGEAYSASTGDQTAFNGTTVYATETQAIQRKFYDTAVDAESGGETGLVPETKELSGTTILGISPLQFNLVDEKDGVYEYKFGTTNTYKVDVVPYVTKVKTKLTDKDGNTPGKYSRTSLGHYAVQSTVDTTKAPSDITKGSETITLSGFNLGGSSVTGTDDLEDLEIKDNTIEFSASNLKSRKLEDLKVGGIPIMNNINNNGANGVAKVTGSNYANWYNRMANGDNNNELDDDIWFDVWEFNDRVMKAEADGYAYGLNMKIGKGQSLVQYSFVTSNKKVFSGTSGTNAEYSSKQLTPTNHGQPDYLLPLSVGLIVTDDGDVYSTVYGGENADDLKLIKNAEQLHCIEVIYSAEGDRGEGTPTELKDQIHSPVFASGKELYFAYYDKLYKQIRFLTGEQLEDENYTSERWWEDEQKRSRIRDTSRNCEVIAGGTDTDRGVGSYVSLAVVTKDDKDTVCAVWYNLKDNKLQYSYKTNANTTTKITGTNASGTGGNGWSKAKDIFTNGGEYCQIVADNEGGIHIAAYVGGSVKYAYAPSYSSSNFKTCVVDVNDVGKNLTLDVALNDATNKKPIPVIGYYSGSQMPKYAKPVDTSWITGTEPQPPAGVDAKNRYTGNWDVSFVPVRKNLIMDRVEKVNVGVWKTSVGVLTYSTTDKSAPKDDKSNIGTSSYTLHGTLVEGPDANHDGKSYSQTYGNGTSNAILCYIIDNGSNIESAQMRGSN